MSNKDAIAETSVMGSQSTASVAIHTRHIPSLDGIRAVSIILVFLAHMGLDKLVPGGFGVTIFFFLSGFLITTLMRAEFEKNGTVNLKHFWLRRILRIFPSFYLVLFGALIITALRDRLGELQLSPMMAQLLHYTNFWVIWHGDVGFPPEGGTDVYWSLAVEEHFYLFFPWLYIAMRRFKLSNHGQTILLMSLCALALVWRYILVTHYAVEHNRTYMGTDTRVDSILFGCALAIGFNPVLDKLNLNARLWKFVIVPGALLLLMVSLLYRDAVFRETFRYSLQGLALAPLFVAAVAFSSWAPFRLLNWRPFAFLGVLSYSFYLVHYGIIFFVRWLLKGFPIFAQGAVVFVLSCTIAWMIYLFVEKPCARLRRRLIN